MEWILCIVVGVIIGLGIAALSKNEDTADCTKIFTEDDCFEKNFREMQNSIKNRLNQIKRF